VTQDEIIEMARQIQKDCVVSEDGYRIWSYEALGSFAKLVAAKEREACAKVCDDEANDDTQDEWQACNCCNYLAEKIRARGEA
jgi:predicted transcriptional regulator